MKNCKILIVDDNPKNIQVLASTLSELYDIEYTTDGYDAINWVKSESFDLILLDIMMPNIDGFQVCKTIREDDSFIDIPIIFLTAKTDTDSIVNGFKIGGQDYITKPFNDEELKARIKTHLELRKSKEKLTDVNKWLENEVEIKTNDLKKAYKELELLDIAKSEFLSLISHELRTPLNGIIGFTQVLKRATNSEQLLEYIKLMEISSNRLLKFTKTAMLITELNTRMESIRTIKFNLADLIGKQIIDNKKLLAKKNSNITFNEQVNSAIINGNKDLIEEALKCILENAVNYSPEATAIEISISEERDNLKLSIIDEGPGFTDQTLTNIFSPFAYGHEHIDKNVGLSLHLVKLIMEAHQGSVSARNNAQGGANISLYFPKTI